MRNAHYRKYDKKKKDIKKKYPAKVFKRDVAGRGFLKYTDEERKLHQSYLKDLLDLIFKPDGDFQQFTWDIMSDQDKMTMERKARGRKWEYDYD